MIYHITTSGAWLEARQTGEYRADSLDSEGFIHCSTRAQVLPVAQRFYAGQTGLLLLKIDPARLSSTLRWEPPSGGSPPPGVPDGDPFPHIYGPINLDAVVNVYELDTDPDDHYILPELD